MKASHPKADHQLMEASLLALADSYDGMAGELFERFMAAHPHYAHAFINPEAAQERMTRETLEVMIGLAAGEYWVETTVTDFVDLHHNYAAFTPEDYTNWFALVIEVMANRAGAAWPKGAGATWQVYADKLVKMVIVAEASRN